MGTRLDALLFVRSAIVVAIVAFAGAGASAHQLPNASLTPGETNGRALDVVCAWGYAHRIRHRYDAEWRRYRAAIFAEYGVPHAQWRGYRIDHLVPLELDGKPFGVLDRGGRPSWDLRNVWPEPKADSRAKDRVENALHEAVCRRRGYRGLHLTLGSAQQAIARDWERTQVGLP